MEFLFIALLAEVGLHQKQEQNKQSRQQLNMAGQMIYGEKLGQQMIFQMKILVHLCQI